MKFSNAITRTLAITLLASTALLAVAPAAQARNNRNVRYKGAPSYRYVGRDHQARRVVVHESGAGPVLAGLIGGFILGTAVSHAQPVVVHETRVVNAPRYRYWDPYCDEWFVSLSDVSAHCWHEGHPRVVKVFNGYEGPCVRTLRWSDGAWYDIGDDWRD